MSLDIGALVVSCHGRDSGTVLAVIGKTETHLILADGRKRRLDKPKHKKIKHTESLNLRLEDSESELLIKGGLTNKMLYRGIKKVLTANSLNDSI